MTQQPDDSIASKIIFIGALLILLLIMGACVFVIYGYLSPQGPGPISSTSRPSPVATYDPTHADLPTPTPTPRATFTPTPEPGPYQEDTKITTGAFEFSYPGIWDHYIVYDEFDGTTNSSILYDTNTGTETNIAEGNVFSYGVIGGGKVLLYYPQGSKMYLYYINDKTSRLTGSNDENARGSFTLYGQDLAYYQDLGSVNGKEHYYEIRVFNVIEGLVYPVVGDSPLPRDIKMYEDKLVYTVYSDAGSDVYLFNRKNTNSLPQKISAGSYARIYGNTIVFISDDGGRSQAYTYDINTGGKSVITTKGEQRHVAIYGNTVVYDDNRDGNWNIYAYDLTTSSERRITNEPHDQMDPVIYGNRIAYIDNREGYWAIYTMTI